MLSQKQKYQYFAIIILTLSLWNQSSYAENKKLPSLNPKSCNFFPTSTVEKADKMEKLYKTNQAEFHKFLIQTVQDNNNIGSEYFNFSDGKKVVYRSAILNKSPLCLTDLVKYKNVKTIINLYDGPFLDEETYPYEESQIFKKAGGEVYSQMMDFTDHYKNEIDEKQVDTNITNIVKLINSSPGNVLIHCVGGWHRTGVVFGVLQKCINKQPISEVIDTYKKHTQWESKSKEGVYVHADVQLISNFNCNNLKNLINGN